MATPDRHRPLRFHVVAAPHTWTSRDYPTWVCGGAFTQTVLNFCKMLRSLGHEVFHYGGEGSTPDCTEHVTIVSREQSVEWANENDWRTAYFRLCREANAKAIEEIGKRRQARDFLCLIHGQSQQPIAQAFPKHMAVEFAISDRSFTRPSSLQPWFSTYKVFASYAWMHYVYGMTRQDGVSGDLAAVAYDCVIPTAFDPADFPLIEQKDDYCLFLGRLVPQKGVDLAVEATGRLGVKLLVAGPGMVRHEPGLIVAQAMTIQLSSPRHG